MDDVPDEATAVDIAESYADEECVGELGEVTEVEKRDAEWLVTFETHTFSDTYTHQIRITTSVGNVIAHERSGRFD